MIKSGRVTSYIAIETLFFSPPDMPFTNLPPTKVFSHFRRLKSVIRSLTLWAAMEGSLIFNLQVKSIVSELNIFYIELSMLSWVYHFDTHKMRSHKTFSHYKRLHWLWPEFLKDYFASNIHFLLSFGGKDRQQGSFTSPRRSHNGQTTTWRAIPSNTV